MAIIRPIGPGEEIRAGIEHVAIINEQTGEEWECQINPTRVQERIRVRYKEEHGIMKAPGDLVYENTSNREIPLRLEVDQDLFPKFDIQDFYRFMKSLCYPVRLGELIGEPPDVLLVWPHLFSLQVKVVGLQTTWEEFLPSLKPRSYRMDLTVRETGQLLITSGEARERVDLVEPSPSSSWIPGRGAWY